MSKKTKDATIVEATVTITENGKVKQDAYKTLMDWVTAQTDLPADVLASAKTIRPSYFGISAVGGTRETDGLNPAYRQLKALFTGGVEVGLTFTLDEAFSTLRFGAREVHKMVRYLVKNPCEGSPIVWIKEDLDTETYTVAAIQNEVPEGWEADLPVAYVRNFAE